MTVERIKMRGLSLRNKRAALDLHVNDRVKAGIPFKIKRCSRTKKIPPLWMKPVQQQQQRQTVIAVMMARTVLSWI
jgi:hypothetical protein